MKTVVILESDNLGLSASDMLNPKELKLIGIGNSNMDTWNVFKDINTGELKDEIEGLPIMPIDLAVALQPELIVVAAATPDKSNALKYMAIRAGFIGDMLFLSDLYQQLTIKGAALRRLTRRLQKLGVEGNVAELGCYNGDISWQLNALMPDRKLYLFDTLEGFDDRDLAIELEKGFTTVKKNEYKYAKEDYLLSRLPQADMVTLKKGWFPETAFDIEDEKFALVYMDASLYQPTFTGMEFFFPRMSQGGVIVLCGYEDPAYGGIRKAIEDLEEKYGAFLILPLGDLMGTVMIVHP